MRCSQGRSEQRQHPHAVWPRRTMLPRTHSVSPTCRPRARGRNSGCRRVPPQVKTFPTCATRSHHKPFSLGCSAQTGRRCWRMLRLLALPSIRMLCSLSLQGCSPLALRYRAPAAAQQHRCRHHHGAPLPLHVWTAGTAWLKPVAVAAAAKTKGKQQGTTSASTTVHLDTHSQAAAAGQRGPPCVIVAVDPGKPPCIHQWHHLGHLAHRSVQILCPTDGAHQAHAA